MKYIVSLIVVVLALLIPTAITPAVRVNREPIEPFQIVSNCVNGVYDECRLIPGGHWYYRQGAEWTRDDGKSETPPVVILAECRD